MPIRYYTSWGRCFAHVQAEQPRPFGWPRRNLFLQPLLERTLRDGVNAVRHASTSASAHELVALEQHAGGASVRTVRDADGRVVPISAPLPWSVPTAAAAPCATLVGVALEGTHRAGEVAGRRRRRRPARRAVLGRVLRPRQPGADGPAAVPPSAVRVPAARRRRRSRPSSQPEHVRGLLAGALRRRRRCPTSCGPACTSTTRGWPPRSRSGACCSPATPPTCSRRSSGRA